MKVCLKCGQVVGDKDKCCKGCGNNLNQFESRDNARIEQRDCPFCEGKGSIPREASNLDRAMHRTDKCEVCNGDKKVTFDLTGNKKLLDCGRCNGTGRQWKVRGLIFHPCDECKGKGKIVR